MDLATYQQHQKRGLVNWKIGQQKIPRLKRAEKKSSKIQKRAKETQKTL